MENMMMRAAYGKALLEQGRINKNIVALDADLSRATQTLLFKEEFPDRHFEMGIAEQNMMSAACGLALTGKIPFVNSFAVFLSLRAIEQFRQSICVGNLSVKVCATSAGLSDFVDGSSHQSVEDIAVVRSIPNATVLSPADAGQCYRMVGAMVEHAGPVYLRINRNEVPMVTDNDEAFEIGKIYQMRDGSDIAIFATGIMVKKALDAAETLSTAGISARVLNVPTIKPIDKEAVIAFAKGMKGVVTAEEHNVTGGHGSAVLECLCREPVPVELVGIRDCFGTCAKNYESLLEHFDLTAEAIVNAAKTF